MIVGILLLVVGLAGAFQEPSALNKKRYDGYKLYSTVPTAKSQLDMLHNMMLNNVHVDFWKEPSHLRRKVEFLVAPQHQIVVATELRKAGLEFNVKVEDMQTQLTAMYEDMDRHRAGSPTPHIFGLNKYNTLDEINQFLSDTAATCVAPLSCELYSIGSSYEGRPINAIRIYQEGSDRKGFYIEATTHAREWITTSTITNIINTLAFRTDADAVRLTDDFDWYLVPVVNVDGYVYTDTNDRLWRKNRNPVGEACVGVDINRNYNWAWGEDGASHIPCGETYCGPSAGSESETQAVSAELVRLGPTLAGMVTLHSYGNMWMFPFGNTVNYTGEVCERAADHDELMRVADITVTAIEQTYNTQWDAGNSCEVIYATSGGTNDYAKGVAGIAYTYVPELRGESFIVPMEQIPEAYQETWNGIIAMAGAVVV